MSVEGLSDQALTRMERVLDFLASRQEAISANLANATTPGYKAIEASFQRSLDDALDGSRLVRTSPGHFELVNPLDRDGQAITFEMTPGLEPGPNGNNVQTDRELLAMTLNRLRFQMAVQGVTHQLRTIRSAIREGQG